MQHNSLRRRKVISFFNHPANGHMHSIASVGGFSLIEVILALGVVAFAFVALFGMLPIGLNAFNNSVDSTLSAQIAENVMTQIKQEKFSLIGSQFNDVIDTGTTAGTKYPSFYSVSGTATYPQPNTGFYFDDQGNYLGFVQSGTVVPSLTTGTANPMNNYVYSAEVQIYYHSQPPYNNQPWLSGTSSSGTFTSSGTYTPATPQPMATAVITVRKISTPKVARIYTGYIDNNGL